MPDEEIPKFDDWVKTRPSRSGVTRFQPDSDWSLDKLADVETEYQKATGRSLPVSVRGQGAIHNRLGYQHQDSADVGVRPGTPEAAALEPILRSRNVPFLSFDRAIPGVATGPHYHIGRPSHRATQTSQSVEQVEVPKFDDWVKQQPAEQELQPASRPRRSPFEGAAGGAGPVRLQQPQQQISKVDLERESYGPDLTVAEVKRAEEQPIGFSRTGQPSRIPRDTDLRVMKGEQPTDRQAYSRRQDAEARLSQMKALGSKPDAKKEAQWRAANQSAIDAETARVRQQIQAAKSQGTDANKWLAEFGHKATAGLLELGAGISGSDSLRIQAEAAARAAAEEGADRNVVSRFVQDVGAGLISSAPELLAMKAGISPVAAFGVGGAVRAGGSGRDVTEAALHGAATGLAFEVPGVGEGVKQLLTKTGAVGAASAGVETALGATPYDALTTGATNALMVGVPGFLHLKFGKVAAVENQKGVPRGDVRVVDEAGAEHVIQKPNLRGQGNNLAIPIKEPSPVEIPPQIPAKEPQQPITTEAAASRTAPLPARVTPATLTQEIKSEPDYAYHATNEERLFDIANEGKMRTHRADEFTDQGEWPDGSTEKRAYFSKDAATTWQFSPEEGRPVVVRTKQGPHIQRESTGDLYSKKPVNVDQLEYLGDDGNWHPVNSLRETVTQDAAQPVPTETTASRPERRASVRDADSDLKYAQETVATRNGSLTPARGGFDIEMGAKSTHVKTEAEAARWARETATALDAAYPVERPVEPAVRDGERTIERVDKPIDYREPNDDYFYTVVPADRVDTILKEGLKPGSKSTVQGGFYQGFSKGKAFLTEREGVGYWKDRIDEHLEYSFDDPPDTVVLRVPKSWVPNFKEDMVGSKDARARSVYVEEPILPATAQPKPTELSPTERSSKGGKQDVAIEKAAPIETKESTRVISTEAGVSKLPASTPRRRKAKPSELPEGYSLQKASRTLHKLMKGDEVIGITAVGDRQWRVANRSDLGRFDTPLEAAKAVTRKGEAGFLNIGRARYTSATTPVLQDVERATRGTPTRTPPSPRSLLTRAQTTFTSQFTPLRVLEKALYGDKKIQSVDMARKFEQVAGAAGKAEADVIEFRQRVVDPIRTHADDFNSYLFLKRVADRLSKEPDRKQVAGWDAEKAAEGLRELEGKVGKGVMGQLEKAGTVYQTEMRRALKLQVDSGRMTENLYQKIIDANDFYAPFKVLKYMEESEGLSGSGRRIATVQDLTKAITGIHSEDFQLGNFLQVSAEQIVRSRILAEKNLKMLELDALADLDPTGDLIARVKSDSTPKPHYERVNYFKDGKKSTLEVQRDVAHAVQGLNEVEAGILTKVLMVGRKPLQVGATSANAAFQVVNSFADTARTALISRYGIRSPLDAVRFQMDWLYSLYSSVKGNFGKPNDLYMDFLKSGAANSTIQRELTPTSFKPTLGLAKGPRHLAKSVIDTVPKFSNAIEESAKLLGLKRGLRIDKIDQLSGQSQRDAMAQLVTEVRNFSGSPDFARRGTEMRQLNLLVMFLNARVQGTASDISRLAGRTGAKDAAFAWGRMGLAVGLPTTALALVNLSDKYRDDYYKIPEWERQNYWMIPRESFFINEDTEEKVRDYWRIPKRNIFQPFANTIESGVEFAQQRESKALWKWGSTLLENLSPINVEGNTPVERLESAAGSLNPAIKLPLIEIPTGRDTFRHRDIVPQYMKKAAPEEQYRASTPGGYVRAGKALGVSPLTLEHAARGATGELFSQFSVRQPQPGRSRLGSYPIARRFVRSGQVANDAGRGERIEEAEQKESGEQVARRRNAITALSEWRGLEESEINAKVAEVGKTDPKLAEKITQLRDERKRGLTYTDKQIAALGIENGARKDFIESELTRLKTQAEREAFLEDLRNKELLPKIERPRRLQRASRLKRQ